MMASNIFSIIIAIFPVVYKSVYQFTCTVQKAPDTSEGDRSLQNYGSSVLPLLLVMFLAHKICRQLPDFLKICVPLI